MRFPKKPATAENEALYDAEDLIGYRVEEAIREHLAALCYRLNPHMARGNQQDWDEVKALIARYLGHWGLPEEVMQDIERKRLRLKQEALGEHQTAAARPFSPTPTASPTGKVTPLKPKPPKKDTIH